MKKRLVTISICTILTASVLLTGCGKKAGETVPDPQGAAEQEEIQETEPIMPGDRDFDVLGDDTPYPLQPSNTKDGYVVLTLAKDSLDIPWSMKVPEGIAYNEFKTEDNGRQFEITNCEKEGNYKLQLSCGQLGISYEIEVLKNAYGFVEYVNGTCSTTVTSLEGVDGYEESKAQIDGVKLPDGAVVTWIFQETVMEHTEKNPRTYNKNVIRFHVGTEEESLSVVSDVNLEEQLAIDRTFFEEEVTVEENSIGDIKVCSIDCEGRYMNYWSKNGRNFYYCCPDSDGMENNLKRVERFL